MTDNFHKEGHALELPPAETPQESLDQLRVEVADLRASRERLVLAADADRRELERRLHDGVQQHLIALAVNLQLAGRLADDDLPAAKALLEEMEGDAQRALDEAAQLAQQIYPALLGAGNLAAALRSAAASAGISASLDVTAHARCSPEVAATVYLCWLAALAPAAVGTRAALTVREDEGELAFEIVADGSGSAAGLERLRDRVEALGGCLTLGSEPGRVAGSLPLSR